MKLIGVTRGGRLEPPPALQEPTQILVAGIGNIFFGDDGFGVEVVRRLRGERFADGVNVVDFGVRGVRLAYELADGRYDGLILVSALPRGGAPGTVYRIEVELPAGRPVHADGARLDLSDAQGLTPAAVLAWLRRFGGRCGRVVVIGCEPQSVDESVGLSAPVGASVDGAMRIVRRVIAEMSSPGLRLLI